MPEEQKNTHSSLWWRDNRSRLSCNNCENGIPHPHTPLAQLAATQAKEALTQGEQDTLCDVCEEDPRHVAQTTTRKFNNSLSAWGRRITLFLPILLVGVAFTLLSIYTLIHLPALPYLPIAITHLLATPSWLVLTLAISMGIVHSFIAYKYLFKLYHKLSQSSWGTPKKWHSAVLFTLYLIMSAGVCYGLYNELSTSLAVFGHIKAAFLLQPIAICGALYMLVLMGLRGHKLIYKGGIPRPKTGLLKQLTWALPYAAIAGVALFQLAYIILNIPWSLLFAPSTLLPIVTLQTVGIACSIPTILLIIYGFLCATKSVYHKITSSHSIPSPSIRILNVLKDIAEKIDILLSYILLVGHVGTEGAISAAGAQTAQMQQASVFAAADTEFATDFKSIIPSSAQNQATHFVKETASTSHSHTHGHSHGIKLLSWLFTLPDSQNNPKAAFTLLTGLLLTSSLTAASLTLCLYCLHLQPLWLLLLVASGHLIVFCLSQTALQKIITYRCPPPEPARKTVTLVTPVEYNPVNGVAKVYHAISNDELTAIQASAREDIQFIQSPTPATSCCQDANNNRQTTPILSFIMNRFIDIAAFSQGLVGGILFCYVFSLPTQLLVPIAIASALSCLLVERQFYASIIKPNALGETLKTLKARFYSADAVDLAEKFREKVNIKTRYKRIIEENLNKPSLSPST